jgi:DNA-directed RNA polymerase specialized sigma24 family protein
VVLHYLEELTIDETAQALGITPGAASTRLSRARAQLRDRIDPTLFHD